MKKILSVFFFFLMGAIVYSQDVKPTIAKTTIKSIIVYLDGAEIKRTKKLNLEKGRNTIVFTGLSPKLDPRSIRISAGEDVSILSVSSKINYLTKSEETPRIKQLKDSVELNNDLVIDLENTKEALAIEKNMLLENKNLNSKESIVTISQLSQAADFYRERMLDINRKISSIEKKIKKKREAIRMLNKELNEMNAQYNYTRGEVTILLESLRTLEAGIDLKYLVRDAGWAPSYDLTAKNLSDPVELVYRGKIFNNTHIDWKDVKLKLSTAEPTKSAKQPELKPWYLKYYSYSANQSIVPIQKQGYMQNIAVNNDQLSGGETQSQPGYHEVEVSALSAEFDINKPYSVPSIDKPYLVDIASQSLNADFKHFSIAKLDRDAFLLARITGWEDLNLLEGPVNIYYDGTFVGESYINTRNISDTLNISLGRDKKVLVTRTKLKDYSSTQFIGSKRKEMLAYEIVVKNNSKSKVNIEVQDQLPVSQNDEIEVDGLEISGAEHNETTGLLKWNLGLSPGESQKLALKFSIKYPKNKQVQVKSKPMMKQRVRMF